MTKPGPSGLLIRPMGLADISALAGLARTIWQASYLDMVGQAQIDYMLAQRYGEQSMRDDLGKANVWWRVALVDGVMTGFSCCHLLGQEEVKLDKLYVHPARQREGLGGALLADAEMLALAAGRRFLVLAVNKRNSKAIGAYRKYGFEVREAVRVDIGGGFVMDDFVMAKCLG